MRVIGFLMVMAGFGLVAVQANNPLLGILLIIVGVIFVIDSGQRAAGRSPKYARFERPDQTAEDDTYSQVRHLDRIERARFSRSSEPAWNTNRRDRQALWLCQPVIPETDEPIVADDVNPNIRRKTLPKKLDLNPQRTADHRWRTKTTPLGSRLVRIEPDYRYEEDDVIQFPLNRSTGRSLIKNKWEEIPCRLEQPKSRIKNKFDFGSDKDR